MKKKILNGKLSLKKKTITSLTVMQSGNVGGGEPETYTCMTPPESLLYTNCVLCIVGGHTQGPNTCGQTAACKYVCQPTQANTCGIEKNICV